MKCKKIVFTKPNVTEYIETELRDIKPDEILVKTEFTVVSGGTERACLVGMPNVYGDFPRQLGYCGIGCIEAVGGEVKGFTVGDRVLIYHGTHSSYNIVKADQLTKVTDSSLESIEAAFVIIASMSLGGVRKLMIETGESVMVMGAGILGAFAVQLARIGGAIPVISADLNPTRRELALRLGADYAFDPAEPDFVEKVKSVTEGKGVNATVEVTGASLAMKQALDCAAWQGRIALLGCTRISDCPIDYYQSVHRPGIQLIGAHNFVRPKVESYPYHWTHQDDCKALMKLISGKRLNVKPMISEIHAPSNAVEVYNRLAYDKNFPVGVVFDWKKAED